MRLFSTGLKALVALALAGVALSASAAPARHDGYHRHAPRHHRVVHHHRHPHHPVVRHHVVARSR